MQGFAMSFALITLTMLVGLKSVRYGLLSLLPNLFPATIVFGLWGLFVGELGPYNLMLFSISIGLVVDDSVHVLSKYIAAKRDGSSVQEAMRYAMDKAGSAITITTASLALGTLMLVFSNTEIFQNVALLITPIIVVALFLDLLFLPPLLMRFDRWLGRYEPKAKAQA
jgi:predicted RND superfamily exporter protein